MSNKKIQIKCIISTLSQSDVTGRREEKTIHIISDDFNSLDDFINYCTLIISASKY